MLNVSVGSDGRIKWHNVHIVSRFEEPKELDGGVLLMLRLILKRSNSWQIDS
jgi:hypothetical protein